MPNWCWNTLSIKGNEKEIAKFKKVLNTPDSVEIICKAKNKETLREEYLADQRERGLNTDDILNFTASKVKPIDEFILDEYRNFDRKHNIQLDENGDVINVIKSRMLNAFYPMPKELENTTSPSVADEVLVAKYGASDWYNWHVKFWGTKWDVDSEISSEDETFIQIDFDSAWSPPCNWLEKVAEDYPDLHFTLEYEEGGMAFKGIMEICNNESIFESNTWDWHGDCGECETDYTEKGHCKCTDENGKKLVWGNEAEDEEDEENEGETEENPCAV
jgi:hypothetical protein